MSEQDPITVQVMFFARLREELDTDQLTASLTSGGTVQTLLDELVDRGGAWRQLAEETRLMIAVNQTMASRTRRLAEGDEVALFPPVTGG